MKTELNKGPWQLPQTFPRRDDAYTGKLRVGAIYESKSMTGISRRITRMQYGNVYYVLHEENKRPVPDCAATESMFRDFTSHEIKPEDL